MRAKNRHRHPSLPVLVTALAVGCGQADEVETGTTADTRQPSPAIPERVLDGGVVVNAPGAWPGYTMFSPYLATTTFLIDLEGSVVHRWQTGLTPAGSAYLMDDGSLLRAADTENARFRSNGTGGRVQRWSWDGELLWDYLVSDEQRMQNHDLEPMPNGNVLIAAWEYRSPEQAIAAGRDPARVSSKGSWPCLLIEVEPTGPTTGRVVWEWNAWDHLVQDFDPTKDNHGDVAAHPELLDINAGEDYAAIDPDERERLRELREQMSELGYTGDDEEEDDDGGDWSASLGADFMHVNGVAYEPELDLLVLSCWELSEVLVIDHSTTTAEAAGHSGGRYGKGGDILYRWGNPQNHRAGGPQDQRFFGQHDARWLPGPRLTVFNNDAGRAEREDPTRRPSEWGRSGRNYSTVDEIELPFDPATGFHCLPGQPFGPDDLSWSYRAEDPETLYGSFISGAQALPNGNTLICVGPKGRLVEVTRDKEVVWEYRIPYAGISTSEFWARFGWGDMGDLDMERDEGEGDQGADDWDSEEFMAPTAAFRATRIPPDHPGLARLER